jgi:hypothetical protein
MSLTLPYRAPHTPLDAPKSYTERFPGEMPERRRQALAMISAVDDGVGLIAAALKQHQLTERTLIYFDHYLEGKTIPPLPGNPNRKANRRAKSQPLISTSQRDL